MNGIMKRKGLSRLLALAVTALICLGGPGTAQIAAYERETIDESVVLRFEPNVDLTYSSNGANLHPENVPAQDGIVTIDGLQIPVKTADYIQTFDMSGNDGPSNDLAESKRDLAELLGGNPSTVYLSQWIYSKEAVSGVTLQSYVQWRDSSTRSGNIAVGAVGWEGWKLVTTPLHQVKSGNYSSNLNNIIRMWYRIFGTDRAKAALYFDPTVWISSSLPSASFAITGSGVPDGYDDMPRTGEIRLSYSQPVDVEKSEISLRSAAGGTTDCTVRAEGTDIYVKPENTLAAETQYTLTANVISDDFFCYQLAAENEITFTTVGEDEPQIESFRFGRGEEGADADELPESGVLSATVTASVADEENPPVLYLAVYDEENNMLDFGQSGAQTETPGEEPKAAAVSGGASITLTASVELSDYAGCRAVAFLCNSADDMRPAVPSFWTLPAEKGASVRQEEGGETVFTDFSAELVGDTLTVTGKLRSDYSRCVLIRLADDNDQAYLWLTTESNQDGSFTAATDVKKSGLTDGRYTVQASARTAEELSTAVEMIYLDDENQEKLYKSINDASDAVNIRKIFEENQEYQSAFSMDALSENEKTNLYQTLYERRPFESYAALTDTAAATGLLRNLNDCVWTEIHTVVKSDLDMIINGEDPYAGLEPNEVGTVDNALVRKRPFADFLDFRTKLAAQIDAQKASGGTGDTDKSPGGHSSSGGGSRGSGKLEMAFDLRQDEVQPSAEPSKTAVFNDLGSVSWAEESIAYLLEQGVISPDEDGRFRPQSEIKREEFVKMLVEAMGLRGSGESAGFSDVDETEWYAVYVNIAWQNGIVKGDDGSFGVGESITREDAATLLYRAAELSGGLTAVREAESFTDAGEISGYAREAVAVMQTAGVLNGMGDGRFAPKEHSTRAQSAKIMYEYLMNSAIKGGK